MLPGRGGERGDADARGGFVVQCLFVQISDRLGPNGRPGGFIICRPPVPGLLPMT